MKNKTAREISYDLVNKLENDLISPILDGFIFRILKDFSPFIKKLPPIYNLLMWVYQSMVKPVCLILIGIYKLIIHSLLLYVPIILIFVFLIGRTIEELLKSNYELELDYNLLMKIAVLVWLILSFFEKVPNHNKSFIKHVNGLDGAFKGLSKEQIKVIKDNIGIYRKNYSKKVLIINSILGIIGGFYLFFFKMKINVLYKYPEFATLKTFDEALNVSLLWFIIGFYVFTRGYSKIYNMLFDILEISMNDALYQKYSKE